MALDRLDRKCAIASDTRNTAKFAENEGHGLLSVIETKAAKVYNTTPAIKERRKIKAAFALKACGLTICGSIIP
jgi:hypothetical protein